MRNIENIPETPLNFIDARLLSLQESSNWVLENFEWLLRCSNFFETGTDDKSEVCLSKDDMQELMSILPNIGVY